MKKILIFFSLLILNIFGESLVLSEFVVPKSSTPPKIDGKIGKGEWDNAIGVSGMVYHSKKQLAPIQVKMYITYTNTHLYIMFDSEKPGKLLAKETERDNIDVTYDDSIEIFINPHKEWQEGNIKGYFHILGNFLGSIMDLFEAPNIGVKETQWDPQYEFANLTEGGRWISEFGISFKELQVKPPDEGDIWYLDLARNMGTFISLVGAYSANGAKVVFTSERVPIFQFNEFDTKAIKEGKLKIGAKVLTKNIPLHWIIKVISPDNKTLIDENLLISNKDSWQDIKYLKEFEIRDGIYKLIMEVKNENLEIYKTTIPFTLFDKQDELLLAKASEQKVTQPIINGGYMPYYKRIYVEVDVQGTDIEKNSDKIEVEVKDKTGKTFTKGVTKLANKRASEIIPIKELEEGEYKIFYRILDEKDNILFEKVEDYKRKKFEWEHNTLGKDDILIPPFTPLKVKKESISCLLKEHKIDGLGLFKSIKAETEFGIEEILGGPIKIEGILSGKKKVAKPMKKVEFNKIKDTEVGWEGFGIINDIKINLNFTMEYDGMTKVKVVLNPPENGTEIEKLTVVIPINEPQFWYLSGYGHISFMSGKVPEGKGIIWDSLDMSNANILGNIIHYIWLGTPERGFTWFVDTDKGWILDDRYPCQEIERNYSKDGKAICNLYIHLINKKVHLKEKAEMEFFMLATPIKPYLCERFDKIVRRGDIWWKVDYFPGTLCYFPEEDKIDAFNKFVKELFKGPFTIYTTPWLIGRMMEETDVFKGEWQTWKEGEYALGYIRGAERWKERNGEKAVRSAWITPTLCPSDIDCRIWYWDKLLRACPLIVGQYWDNFHHAGYLYFPLEGYGYLRDGKPQPCFSLMLKRELLKRMAVVTYKLRENPELGIHNTDYFFAPLAAFINWALTGETRQYNPINGESYMKKWPVESFTSIAYNKQYGIRQVVLGPFVVDPKKTNAYTKENLKKSIRSARAQFALHDIWQNCGIYMSGVYGKEEDEIFMKAAKEFGIENKDVKFIGYWRSQDFMKAENNIKISFYKRDNEKKFFICAVNDTDNTWEGTIFFKNNLFRDIKFWDGEKRMILNKEIDTKKDFGIKVKVSIPPQDYIVIEGGEVLPEDLLNSK